MGTIRQRVWSLLVSGVGERTVLLKICKSFYEGGNSEEGGASRKTLSSLYDQGNFHRGI